MEDELAQAEIGDTEAEAYEDEATGLPERTVALIGHE